MKFTPLDKPLDKPLGRPSIFYANILLNVISTFIKNIEMEKYSCKLTDYVKWLKRIKSSIDNNSNIDLYLTNLINIFDELLEILQSINTLIDSPNTHSEQCTIRIISIIEFIIYMKSFFTKKFHDKKINFRDLEIKFVEEFEIKFVELETKYSTTIKNIKQIISFQIDYTTPDIIKITHSRQSMFDINFKSLSKLKICYEDSNKKFFKSISDFILANTKLYPTYGADDVSPVDIDNFLEDFFNIIAYIKLQNWWNFLIS